MIIDNKFNIGDIVYVKTDTEQSEFTIISIKVEPNGLMYEVVNPGNNYFVYDFEITYKKDILKTL